MDLKVKQITAMINAVIAKRWVRDIGNSVTIDRFVKDKYLIKTISIVKFLDQIARNLI